MPGEALDARPDQAPKDAPPVVPGVVCDSSDPTLRLCVDFEAPLGDRSRYAAAISAANVEPLNRDGAAAALLSTSTTIHVREAASLDIANAVTLDMWIRPTGVPATGSYWFLDNNTQYAAAFTANRTLRCVIGNRNAESTPIPNDGQFHHVACVYDQTQLKMYVDGGVSNCLSVNIQIPTGGDDGLAIGANLSGTNDAPTFAESFVGGLDDVRVWARADVDLCAAASRTGCKTTCD